MRKKKPDLLQELIQMTPYLDENYQLKMDITQSILNDLNLIGPEDTKIKIGTVRLDTFTYFIYTILTEYEKLSGKSKNISDYSIPDET